MSFVFSTTAQVSGAAVSPAPVVDKSTAVARKRGRQSLAGPVVYRNEMLNGIQNLYFAPAKKNRPRTL